LAKSHVFIILKVAACGKGVEMSMCLLCAQSLLRLLRDCGNILHFYGLAHSSCQGSAEQFVSPADP
jgi:hypothetical protein